MFASSIIDYLPLWVFNLLVSAIVLLSLEAGWRLGNYRHHRFQDEKAPVNAAVGAALNLLAFLLAFTFGMAASRFDSRKQAVLNEANAIGTTYLRTELLPQPLWEPAAQPPGRVYAPPGRRGSPSIMSKDGMARAARFRNNSGRLPPRPAHNLNSISTGLFIQSINETIDLDAARITANRNRIPDSIWLMLGLVTVFSMAAIGIPVWSDRGAQLDGAHHAHGRLYYRNHNDRRPRSGAGRIAANQPTALA